MQNSPLVVDGQSMTGAVPRQGWRRQLPGPIVFGAFAVLALAVFALVFAPLLIHNPNAQDLAAASRPPGTAGHLLGTDDLGRDELKEVVFGTRTSVVVAVLAVLMGAVIGVLAGMLAGYGPGFVDEIVMRLVDIQLGVPAILFVLVAVTIARPSFISIVVVLALSEWVIFARLGRAQVMVLREQDMVVAVRSLGVSHVRLMLRHILPNMAGPLIVVTTLELANLILAQAALGYLGLGIPPPTPSLGAMISEGQANLTTGIWWPVVVPGAAIALLILAFNIVGDWLRDLLDPKSAQRG